MDWLYYLLEANLYLLFFYGFYRLFLQDETFYNSNRYYLLFSSFTAFLLPIIQLGTLNPTAVADNEAFPMPILYTEEQLAKIAAGSTQINADIDYTTYLYPIYLCVALCFAIKLVFSLSKIIRLWRTAKKANRGTITVIELSGEKSAFSFFNLLFIHPHLAEKQTVLKHEMVHIKQKHSLDILYFEILQIICWFNPIIYFIKKDIKLLHEYIADELSTNAEMQKHEYAMFLIENSFGVVPTPLTNQIFNQSILKRRINMLNKKRTTGWARLRLLLVLPLGGAMLCTSTMAFTKDYGYIDLLPEKSISTTVQAVPKVENTKKQTNPKVENVKKDQIKFPPPIVKNSGTSAFTPIYAKDKTTGKPVLRDHRLVVINGKAVENLATFYGVYNAGSIKYHSKESAKAKYGDKGKNGAVEITGKDIKYYAQLTFPALPPDQVKFPPPIVKRDQIKFPPPIVRPSDQDRYIVYYEYDKDHNPIRMDKRYVIVNGTPVTDQDQFYGAENLESITLLNHNEAIKKYGDKATWGAVEITGSNIKYFGSDVVKFPPPIVKSDQKTLKTPPAVEPPPPGFKPKKHVKKDQVKFPPPIVKPDQKKQGTSIKSNSTTNGTQASINLKVQRAIQKEIDSAQSIALKLKKAQ